MEWVDDGIVIGLRKHGETSAIVELLTSRRGRQVGFIHGARSRRLRPTLQAGNTVRAVWKARTEEQMGTLVVEALKLRAADLMGSGVTLQGANLLCALARLLPEREPQDQLYGLVEAILDNLDDRARTPAAVVRLELLLLRELGFGLDLDRCAVTGLSTSLAYVSPKTGRAVSREAGEPYRERILALPAFLIEEDRSAGSQAILDGFTLTEYFLRRDVFGPRGLEIPDCRRAYIAAVTDPGFAEASRDRGS